MMNEIKYNKAFAIITKLLEKYSTSGRFSEVMVKSVADALTGKDLHISVIGKMKAGKSSFSNALIFRDSVLPSGAAPTTVTLTEIIYAENASDDNKVEVELLTSEDIQNLIANKNSDNPIKAKNAQELLSKIEDIPGGYTQYLSKGVVSITLDELNDFTSATGKLSGLAKKVTIYKHLPTLCGLRITDTPGFNDPIKSRREATREALKESHIILFVHDYLDKYDEDEISILIDQVEYTGVSQLVDVINKMDANEDLELSQWSSYLPKFEKKKDEAVKQISKEGVKNLLNNSISTYVSALMALIGYIMQEYDGKKAAGEDCEIDNDIKDFYVQYQCDFPELKNGDDFIKFSNISDVIKIINKLSEDKSKYLAAYPIQTLVGVLKSVIDSINAELAKKKNELDKLNVSTADAKRQLDAINQTFKALGKAMNSGTLATKLRDCIRDTKHEIQKERDRISSNEFTTDNYENDRMFGTGPEKRNLSRYKIVLSDLDNYIRDSLEKLKDNFKTESENHVRKVMEGLSTEVTKYEDREELSQLIIGIITSEISKGLPIAVNPNEPSDYLYGAGTQASIYKSDFLDRRKDSSIEDKYLKIFKSFVEDTIDSDILRNAIAEQIEELKSTLKNALNYSPAEKEEEGLRLNQEIQNLEQEIKDVKKDIKDLSELK